MSVRMNWKERIQHHDKSGNPVKLRDVNMIAGELIRGLGFPANQLEQLERSLDITYDDHADRFTRAVDVFTQLMGRTYGAYNWFGRQSNDNVQVYRLKAVELKFTDWRTVMPAMQAAAARDVFEVACYRVNDEAKVHALYICPTVVDDITPPYCVLDVYKSYRVVRQSLRHFIASFKPEGGWRWG